MAGKALIIGGTAGVGKAITYGLAKLGFDLFIVGRNQRDISALCSDIKNLYCVKAYGESFDLNNGSVNKLKKTVQEQLGNIDKLFLVAGVSDKDRDFEKLTEAECQNLVNTNFLGHALVLKSFQEDLLKSKEGGIVVLSSAAASRPRASNTIYAASKAGLEFLIKGLSTKWEFQGVKIQIYRLGFIATRMTFGQKSILPIAAPEEIANSILKRLNTKYYFGYLPKWWSVLMLIYQLIPRFLFKHTQK